MEPVRRTFTLSFKLLLADITQSFQWPAPIYHRDEVRVHVCYVILRMPTGVDSYCIEGRMYDAVVEYEEAAAEEAVDVLAIRYKLKIDDVNFEARERYRRCAKFYKGLRAGLRSLPASEGVLHSAVPPKGVVPEY